ncbi:FAR1-RELATED SEQUENCE 2 protein [Nymphaea thermarum]|nr:FAR1-RELATED SEQUENCE 2 protein [Nymphaea thermarum]
MDEDGYATYVFWANSRSMLDYGCFNDVLIFDTIVKTFEWLFKVFTEAMNMKHHKFVLMDGDSAIYPSYGQRHIIVCVCSIYSKMRQKNIWHVMNQRIGFKESFANCVLKCRDGETFKCTWTQMIETYSLQENSWLQKLYKDKEKWTLAYVRQYFLCKHEKHIESREHARCTKKEIVLLLTNISIHGTLEKDVKAFVCRPQSLGMNILDQTTTVYTPTMFEWLKEEAIQATNCDC